MTDKGCVWNNYGTDLFSIDQGGNLTALKVGGPSPLEVTANATDEWGRELLVTCDVTVTPAFSIRGGDSVEHGESITLDIESPDYINPSLITWALDNNAVAQSYVQLTKDSDGKCVVYCIGPRYDQTAREYTPITIKCTIDGAPPVELTKDIVAIERQPKAVAIEGLIYDQDVLEKKKGEQFTIAASIEPASVNTSHFRIKTEPTWPVQQPMGQDYLVGQDYGTAEVKVIITDDGYNHYFYPLNKTVERVIKVNVEPYWIETISLPATVTLNPGNETSLTPEFTSDVDGHQPTNTVNGTDLIWSVVEQSEADVISITPAGFITANKVGTAKIRVTTTGDWTTKDKTPKYAECTIVVEKKADNAPKVGDYYYSDGTWGTDSAPSGKSVIGVVFSTTNATLTDSYLNPIYTHGLVVGFTEYNTTFGLHTKDDYNSNSSYKYFQSAGFPTTPRDDENQKVMGYTHTLALKGYRTARGGGDWAKLVTILDGLDTPTGGSEWYIPSFAEMKILKDIADTINSKLDAHGDPLQTQSYYWPSTLMKSPSYNDLITQPFNMSTGTWKDSNDAYDNEKNNPYPARVVFAF